MLDWVGWVDVWLDEYRKVSVCGSSQRKSEEEGEEVVGVVMIKVAKEWVEMSECSWNNGNKFSVNSEDRKLGTSMQVQSNHKRMLL